MSEYKSGDRIVANVTGYVGKPGKVIRQSKVTQALTVQLDGLEHETSLMPYELQREEVWKQTHPDIMKLSDWLDTYTSSHGIYRHERIAANFKEKTGHEPCWPTHTISETKVVMESRGLGGSIEGKDSDICAWGWEIANAVAVQHVNRNFKNVFFGRGRIWQAAIDALRSAGL